MNLRESLHETIHLHLLYSDVILTNTPEIISGISDHSLVNANLNYLNLDLV